MIGMVLVTHGRLAAEFVSALEHVVGPQRKIAAICIGPEDDMEMRRADILAAVAEVEEGDGVAVLTDMFGGTPSNKRGLHARAAAKFVKLTGQFAAEVSVSKDGASVSGRSIMGLMMLAAGPGTELTISAAGDDAAVALEAIAALIAARFDED